MKVETSRRDGAAILRCLRALLRCALSALLASGAPARAQTVRTPAELPPSSDLAPRPAVPATDTAVLPSRGAVPRALGKRDDDFTLDVTAYEVAPDAPAALRAALPRLTSPYVGPGRSYDDLNDAAAEVTRFLQREVGDYLGYAYLPAQRPEGGVVRIAVLEGRLDRVVLNWSDGLPVRREVVEAHLARLVPGAVLHVRDIERVVFLVNDLRGIEARFEIGAGSQPGTATLTVTVAAEPRYSLRGDFDMNGSRFLGTQRIGGLAALNSPLGRGDALTLTGLASVNGGLRFGLVGYTTPVGSNGIKVGASLSGVTYRLSQTDFPLDVSGSATIGTAYGLYPWTRSRNLNLFMVGSVERKDYTDHIAALQTRKTIDSLTLGVTGDFRDSLLGGAVSTYDANVSRGRLSYTEGVPPTDVDAAYTKLGFGFTRLQDVKASRLLVYLALRGQWARNNLDTTEQFRIGGPDAVRAFAPGEGTGDGGVLGTAELRLLPPESWFGRTSREIVFGLFYDAGRVKHRQRPDPSGTAATDSDNWAGFSGAGLAVAWVRPKEFALRASLAKAISGDAKSDPKSTRFYLQLNRPFL